MDGLLGDRKAGLIERAGGRVLADALVAQEISHVFAVPGESYLDVLDGLYHVRDRLKLVTCRFEAAAVTMAEAYGKLTGRPAAAMVTRGPGACHGAIGVHVAMQDSTPLLLFIGQIPFAETDRDSFQEVDYRRMFGPLAKWVTQIDDAAAHSGDWWRTRSTSRPPAGRVRWCSRCRRRCSAQMRGACRIMGPARASAWRFPIPRRCSRMQAICWRGRASRSMILGGGTVWTEARAARRFASSLRRQRACRWR